MESGSTFPCPFCEGQRITWAGKNVLRSNKGINALAEMFAAPVEEGGGGGLPPLGEEDDEGQRLHRLLQQSLKV